MSAEDGGTQPPVGGGEKSQAAKPAATFSSFINKNTTGKKFAPKAVARRRPGATAPAASTAPKPPAPEPARHVEASTSQQEPESSNAAIAEHATTAQLPTPAPTQEPVQQNVSRAPLSTSVPPPTPATASEQTVPTTSLAQDHMPVTTQAQADEEQPLGRRQSQALPEPTTLPVDIEPQPTRAAKRGRLEDTAQNNSSIPEPAVARADTRSPAEVKENVPAEAPLEDQADVVAGNVESNAHDSASAVDPNLAQSIEEDASAPRTRRRVLPWVAVNQSEVQGENSAPGSAKKAPIAPKRGRRKAAAPATADDVEESVDNNEGDDQPTRKSSSAATKARAKRKANTNSEKIGGSTTTPAKRTRRSRQTREQETEDGPHVNGELENDDGQEQVAAQRRPRKPRQPRRKKQASEGGDGDQAAAAPKRKGRPPREPTPPDAEDHVIDPGTTFMDSLASRNIRVGKLSTREQEMRKIDWVAVRQRRREEDARPIETKQAREERERITAEQVQSMEANVRMHVVDGNIELVPGTTTLDREADADREIEHYETVEERDLTTRITSRSFMKNNKRWPNEFILPGQGKRWTAEDTALFYQGLRSFGTDFQMISRMFPGSTRRSIKTKFTREEREHPDDVREALLGQSELTQHWDTFLKASQMEEEQFADADEIKRQLAEEEAEFRERIAAATAETLERKRQQREAGLLDEEGEGNEASNKENGKAKKKRKGKEKQVAFQEEEGVEIIGDINDDDTWGQE